MKIQLKRVYEINYDGTSASFIAMIDQWLQSRGEGELDSLDMGDAVHTATMEFDAGNLTHMVDIVDFEYIYIDCPDSSTLLHIDGETGQYKIIANTDQPDYKSPAEKEHEAKS